MTDDRRIKIIMDDGGKFPRVFAAAGDTVEYRRDTHIQELPPYDPGRLWPKKIRTVHTLTWETVSYE